MLTIPACGTVWGWPWHGLIQSATIGSTGKTHTQPAVCDSWLIDMGLPAISLSTAETDDATAHGYEWRNYALIPGGYLYGTSLGANTYIHVDAASIPWLIALAYSFPASQTLRITATIKRFGLFGHGEQTAITKIVDVVCTEIELDNAVSAATFSTPYTSRAGVLFDVWTNGSKALIGVMLDLYGATDLFSLIELTASGTGGADGSDLVLAASEIKAQPDLTTGAVGAYVTAYTDSDVPTAAAEQETSNTLHACPDPPGSATYTIDRELSEGTDFVRNQNTPGYVTHARYAFYASDASAKAVRLRYGSLDTSIWEKTADWSPLGYTLQCDCTDPTALHCTMISGDHPQMEDRWTRTTEAGWWLFENDTVVDKWTHTTENLLIETQTTSYLNLPIHETISENTTYSWSGSLTALLPAYTGQTFSGVANLIGHFRAATDNTISDPVTIVEDSIQIRLHRMNRNAIGFCFNDGSDNVYSNLYTPLGALTTTLTPSASNHFTWQRKTGDYQFAANLLAYV